MKILMLSWNFPPTTGGIEYVMGNLFLGLRDRGHHVEVVAGAHPRAKPEDGVYRASRPGLIRYLVSLPGMGWKRCRRSRPDLLVCGSVVTAPAAWCLARLFRRPFLVLAHGSDILHPNWFYQRIVRFLFRRATRVAANSAPTRELLRGIGVPADRIDVVFPGVRVKDFRATPGPGPAPLMARLGDRPVLLSVGRMIRRKGLLEFVRESLPELVSRFPDLALVIVGGDAVFSLVHTERMGAQIEAQAAELGLSDHVFLTGPIPDEEVPPLYHRADVFVLPCLDIPGDVEGFGIVFLEAALANTPAVATRVGGIPDAVLDGETGLLVEPADFSGLADAVGRLLDDRALRDRLGAAAKQRATSCFSWSRVTELYEEAFQRCLGEGSA